MFILFSTRKPREKPQSWAGGKKQNLGSAFISNARLEILLPSSLCGFIELHPTADKFQGRGVRS